MQMKKMNAVCLYSILLACWMAGLADSKEISTSKATKGNNLDAPITKNTLQPKPNIRPKEPTSKDLIPEEIKDGVLPIVLLCQTNSKLRPMSEKSPLDNPKGLPLGPKVLPWLYWLVTLYLEV